MWQTSLLPEHWQQLPAVITHLMPKKNERSELDPTDVAGIMLTSSLTWRRCQSLPTLAEAW
jgi:hypothetical protein